MHVYPWWKIFRRRLQTPRPLLRHRPSRVLAGRALSPLQDLDVRCLVRLKVGGGVDRQKTSTLRIGSRLWNSYGVDLVVSPLLQASVHLCSVSAQCCETRFCGMIQRRRQFFCVDHACRPPKESSWKGGTARAVSKNDGERGGMKERAKCSRRNCPGGQSGSNRRMFHLAKQ